MQKFTIDIDSISGKDKILPLAFRELAQPVTRLFLAGDRELLQLRPLVAVVGARKMTSYGKQVTSQISRELARAGGVIVSGLAIGIDSEAHKAALDVGGKTIAVLPGPIYKIYPSSHRKLAEKIINSGGLLISEYSEPIPPMKYQFIARNRIIAALADAVIVAEAGMGSGSRHTAEFAMELGKNVGAVPGNIDHAMSTGANELIKTGATPILSSQDALDLVDLRSATKFKYIPSNEAEAALINALSVQPQATENILAASQLDAAAFNINMTMLELKGIAEQTHGNKWRLI